LSCPLASPVVFWCTTFFWKLAIPLEKEWGIDYYTALTGP
jgi:hypothetical protein